MKNKKFVRITKKDRDRIELWYEIHTSAEIARRLEFNRSTITRELGRGRDSQGKYRSCYAHKKSVKETRSRTLGKRKIFKVPLLKTFIETKLVLAWSPYQIAKKLKEIYTDTTMHISHEVSINISIFFLVGH